MLCLHCSVKVEIVLFDGRDEPLSAEDSSKTLEESGAKERLQQVTGQSVAINTPPPSQSGDVRPAAGKKIELEVT